MSYLRPILPSVGPLTAVGTVVKRGRRVAFAERVLADEAGTIYATATSSLLVMGPQGLTRQAERRRRQTAPVAGTSASVGGMVDALMAPVFRRNRMIQLKIRIADTSSTAVRL